MASWCWIFPRSIPAIAAQAALSLLVLLAITAPSLHSATLSPRLQVVESAAATIGENDSPGESARTAESSGPAISPRPAISSRTNPQIPTSVLTASPKPSEPNTPADASGEIAVSAETSDGGLKAGAPEATAQGLKNDAAEDSPDKEKVASVGNPKDEDDPEHHEEEEEAKSRKEPNLPPPAGGNPVEDPNSSTTSSATRSTPNDATTSVAASVSTLTIALCAILITSS